MNNKLTVPIAIVLGGVIVAIAVYVSTPKKSSTGSEIHAELVRPVGGSDHIFGNPAAKVLIVEYSDFDCAYCKTFDETLRQIVANEGAKGDVAWVFREFPLTEIHQGAMADAEAAECAAVAGGNDAFWQYAGLLFENQPADPSRFGEFAQSLGLPADAFASCYADASSTVAARITADRQNALDMGAQGTPFSLILVAGKPPVVLNGGYSYDAAKALVDEALKNAR